MQFFGLVNIFLLVNIESFIHHLHIQRYPVIHLVSNAGRDSDILVEEY